MKLEDLIRKIIQEEIAVALEQLDVEKIVQDKMDEINLEFATKEFVCETIEHERKDI